jgi:alkylation response protein AidB-like acyl-CoA dehydrogenase
MTELSVADLRVGVRSWLLSEQDSLAEFRDAPDEPAEKRWSREARFMRRMFDAGWNRWGWPAEFGGLGGSPILRNALFDELERCGYRVPEHYIQLEVQGPPLIHFAPHLAAEVLPAALSGQEMWTQGFSEPEAGSDLAALRCRAVRDGDHFVINGQKIWSSYAVSSRRMGVLARTGTPESRHRGLTMFFIDLESPGVEVRPIAYANGRNELAEVFYTDLRVHERQIVGAENEGWAVAMYLLQFERANYAWMRQAHVSSRLATIADEVSADVAGAAAVIGDIWLRNLALRSRCGASALRLAAGERIGPEASIDKVLLAQAEQSLHDASRDLLPEDFLVGDGDAAATWRSEWFYSRAASIYGGAGEVQRGIIADHLLGLPKEERHGR